MVLIGVNMDLKCKKLNCKYNNCFACMSNKINVTKNCECASFERAETLNEKQKQDVGATMFEAAPEMHPYRHNKEVDIQCDANCLFNKDSRCNANGICVCEEKSPICATFIEK